MNKKSKIIKDITLEDFKKLNLVGWVHEKRNYKKDENGLEVEIPEKDTYEIVKDSKGGSHVVYYNDVYTRIDWFAYDLFEKIEEYITFAIENRIEPREIYVALHKQDSISSIERERLFENSYFEKYLVNSAQTFLILGGVKHLYSLRRRFVSDDGEISFSKDETEIIYLIRY